MSERLPDFEHDMTAEQEVTLRRLCDGYKVEFDPNHYLPAFDLPDGWLCGWVGGLEHMAGTEHPTLYVGVSPEGSAHS